MNQQVKNPSKKVKGGQGANRREAKRRARKRKAEKINYQKRKEEMLCEIEKIENTKYYLVKDIMKCPYDVVIYILSYVNSHTVLNTILNTIMIKKISIYNSIIKNGQFLECLNVLHVCKGIPKKEQPHVRRLELSTNFSTKTYHLIGEFSITRMMDECINILAEKFPNIQELVINNGTSLSISSFTPFKNLKILHFKINTKINNRLSFSGHNYIPMSVDEVKLDITGETKNYFDNFRTLSNIKSMKAFWESEKKSCVDNKLTL